MHMKTYKSKSGPELIIPLALILLSVGTIMVVSKIWIGLAVIVLLAVFIVHMFITTLYQVNNRFLKIRCGFFFNEVIDIASIQEIRDTRNFMSAPATSLDRIEIKYLKVYSVIISPHDKSAFIHNLSLLNPLIMLRVKSTDQRD